jgi:hypothetical protein
LRVFKSFRSGRAGDWRGQELPLLSAAGNFLSGDKKLPKNTFYRSRNDPVRKRHIPDAVCERPASVPALHAK